MIQNLEHKELFLDSLCQALDDAILTSAERTGIEDEEDACERDGL